MSRYADRAPGIPRYRRSLFTLIEIILCAALLGMLVFFCTQVLITTLQTKAALEEQYATEKVKAVGWHIMYRDLANAVGIYYLDGTTWTGPGAAPAAAPPPEAQGDDKKAATAALDKFKRQGTDDMLFEFKADSGEESFLCVAVAQGRLKIGRKDLGFRKVRYFLLDSPEEDGGRMVLRTEEEWIPNKKKDAIADKGLKELTSGDILAEYRNYAVLEGLESAEFSVYNGEEWLDEWDSTKMKALPLALRVKYREKGKELERLRIIPVPISDLLIKEPLEADGF